MPDSIKDKYHVQSIKKQLTYDWLLNKHYAKKIPQIMYSFGLYLDKLEGVCTFGYPPSVGLIENLMSGEYQDSILELNRLCINDNLDKNVLSYFVSCCLNLLPGPLVIVSYADPNQNHCGYIYQATNWIYTGLGSATPKWFNKTTQTSIHDKWVQKYKLKGHDLIKTEQKPKHRYVMFICNKRTKRKMRELLKYKQQPYPKGDNKRYDASYKPVIQVELF